MYSKRLVVFVVLSMVLCLVYVRWWRGCAFSNRERFEVSRATTNGFIPRTLSETENPKTYSFVESCDDESNNCSKKVSHDSNEDRLFSNGNDVNVKVARLKKCRKSGASCVIGTLRNDVVPYGSNINFPSGPSGLYTYASPYEDCGQDPCTHDGDVKSTLDSGLSFYGEDAICIPGLRYEISNYSYTKPNAVDMKDTGYYGKTSLKNRVPDENETRDDVVLTCNTDTDCVAIAPSRDSNAPSRDSKLWYFFRTGENTYENKKGEYYCEEDILYKTPLP